MRSRHVVVTVLVCLLMLPVIAYFVLSVVPGFASFVVVGGSMEPTIDRGSLVYVQETNEYDPGDVITFTDNDRVITHRIVSETADGYVTRGDGNEVVDDWRVSEHQIIGEIILEIPMYGHLLGFVTTSIGYIVVVSLPGVVLIGLEARHLLEELQGK